MQATFHRLMETWLGNLQFQWCICHDTYGILRKALGHIKWLKAAGLKLKPSKCEFFKSQVTYLGHLVSQKGVETDIKKIKAIKE